MTRQQYLRARRAELRNDIQDYDSFLFSRYHGSAGRAYGGMMARPLKKELMEVELELGLRHPSCPDIAPGSILGFYVLPVLRLGDWLRRRKTARSTPPLRDAAGQRTDLGMWL